MSDESVSLPENLRREVFAALVAAQDGGRTVSDSRREVAARFGVSTQELAQIEREGMDKDWPPL
jgi:hypothetical protein